MNDFFTENFNILQIIVCTYVSAGVRAALHRNRQSHGLVIQLSGIREYKFITGEMIRVEPGQIFYLPKFSSYDIKTIEDGDCIAVNFQLTDETVTYPPFVCSSKNSAHHISNFKKIHKTWYTGNVGYINLCYRYLYEIISDIQAENNTAYLPSKKRRIAEHAADFINKNLSDTELTVAEVADYMGMSPEYLRCVFKIVYNTSPRKYIISRRISKAVELMSLKNFKVKEIAEFCGFNDATYFSTEFKKHTGYTPANYLKKLF